MGWANVLVQTAWTLGVKVDQSVKSFTEVRLVIMMQGQGVSLGTGDVALALQVQSPGFDLK